MSDSLNPLSFHQPIAVALRLVLGLQVERMAAEGVTGLLGTVAGHRGDAEMVLHVQCP